jgi:uncharacterized membrane protein (UPF0127 family)
MLLNARTNDVIADHVELADTRATRRRGLLGRNSMDPSEGLILLPSFAIHTAFMRFPIDVVFVNREGVVVRIARDLGPWRMAVSWRAHAVIEFAGGSLRTRDVRPGDRLYLAAERSAEGAAVSWPLPA